MSALFLCEEQEAVFTAKKETRTSDKPTIKIEVSLPLSGRLAFAGDNIQKSINMAMDDLKKRPEIQLRISYQR